MIHGRDLILSDSQTGSGHFACATSCSVTTKSDFIETAHPTEGGWKRYKPTILSWSASTGHLLASYSNYKYFRSMQENKQAVTIRFYDAELQIFYKGQAFIETLDLTGDVNGLAKMKVSLQPSGPLEHAIEWGAELGDIVEQQRHLEWNAQTKNVKIRANDGVTYDNVTFTGLRNRITLYPKRGVVSGNYTQFENILMNGTDAQLNAILLAYPQIEKEDVLVGPGTYTIFRNVNDADGSENDYTYISSF